MNSAETPPLFLFQGLFNNYIHKRTYSTTVTELPPPLFLISAPVYGWYNYGKIGPSLVALTRSPLYFPFENIKQSIVILSSS
jgi:hypothetical protein